MTRLERYKEKLKEFEHKRNNFMRQGRYDLMRRLDNDIADLRREIANAEQYEAKPIKQLLLMYCMPSMPNGTRVIIMS